jgi:hypothetical protein
MKQLLCFVLLLVGVPAHSAPQITWHEGSLVLSDGVVKQGELSFQTSEVVLFRDAESFMVYKPHQVASFYFFDREANMNRKYFSIGASQVTSRFYEVVVWGKLWVVRQLKSAFLIHHQPSDKFDYQYFIYDQDRLTDLKQFKRLVLPTLTFQNSELFTLIKEKGLDPNQKADVIRIVKYYNQSTAPASLVSIH